MKSILILLSIICTFQLSAQFENQSESNWNNGKNSLNFQVNTSDGVGLNFERQLFNKGKYSVWGQAGVTNNLPGIRKNYESSESNFYWPIGFSVNLGLANKWEFNESHSLQLAAGIRRFQFYKSGPIKDVLKERGFEPLSKYLELDYRFQPKNSKMFFTAGYRNTFSGDGFQFGSLKFGVGFKF